MRQMLALAALVPGCVIPTEDTRARFELHRQESTLTFRAYFFDTSTDDPVDIGDAKVTLTVGELEIVSEKGTFGYWTELELETPIAAEEPVSITVLRDGESPITSTVMLSEQLAFDPIPLFISRSKELSLSWQPITEDPMLWEVTDYCVGGSGEIPGGGGSTTIPANAITLSDSYGMTCMGHLVMTRGHRSVVASAFASSEVWVSDRFSIAFASTP